MTVSPTEPVPVSERPFSAPAMVTKLLAGSGFMPVWLATGVLFVVAAIAAPDTLGNDSFSSLLPLMTFLAVTALGQMLVILTGGIDLSIPGTLTLVAFLVVGQSHGSNGNLATTIVICLAWSALIGLINGFLVGIARLNPLIVTLAVGQILIGVATYYSGSIANESSVPPALSSFAIDRFLGMSLVFWFGIGAAVVVAVLLRYTSVGRRFQVVGANPRAAWISGVHVRSYVVFAYVGASVLYGAAGILLVAFIKFPSLDIGGSYLLGPIAAVVIGGASLAGGLASVASTWAGAFALTLLSQMLQVMGLSTAWQDVVFGLAIMGGMVISGERIVGVVGGLLQRPDVRRRIGLGDHEASDSD